MSVVLTINVIIKNLFIGTFSSHKEFSLAQACAAGKRLSKLTYWDLMGHSSTI